MDNPYQPPPLYRGSESVQGSEDVQRGWFVDFASRLPTLAIAYAAWFVWVWFVSYDSDTSASDIFGILLFGVIVGLFASKLFRGSIYVRVFIALFYSSLPLILIISYRYFVKQVPMKPAVELIFGCTVFWLGALTATYVIAKIFQLMVFGWNCLRRCWRTTASLDFDVRSRSATAAILLQRLILVFLPLVLCQILENAVLTVRTYWFHDFAFIDPWLWFTAPIAFGLTVWAFQPTWQGRSRIVVAIACSVSFVVAAVLLVLALPFGYAITSLLDESAKPETRWKVCNLMIAVAWFYSGFVRDYVEQNTHVSSIDLSSRIQ